MTRSLPCHICCLYHNFFLISFFFFQAEDGIRDPPFSVVVAVRVSPLSVCLMVTVTPGITPPVPSRTTPDMVPVEIWAKTREELNAMSTTIAAPNLPNTCTLLTMIPAFLSVPTDETEHPAQRGFR